MKQIKYIVLAVALMLGACTNTTEKVDFSVDVNTIEMEAVGGVHTIRVESSDAWTATTDAPWITISPTNGKGTADCQILIDSALVAEPRSGEIRIQTMNINDDPRRITVSQEGYPYMLTLSESDVELECYDEYDDRHFEITVKSNVDFDVKIPDNVAWLTNKSYKLDLNRGLRPREVNIRFDWGINSRDTIRLADVQFIPKQNVNMSRQDVLKVRQLAAEPIKENTREGDSVALLAIYRTLRAMTAWDSAQSMDNWSGIELWEEDEVGKNGCTADMVGRVKSASFLVFFTKESLPYEVRFLTAARELSFFGNANSFLLSLDEGESISYLSKNLKRLTIGAYGLSELSENIAKLKNLEYLNIGSNNFQKVPEVLTKENFPKLRTLIMNAEQRHAVYDLSNNTKKELGGLLDEPGLPIDLIKWDLDTLVMSVNYLHGTVPDFKDDPDFEVYTQADIDAVDTLPQILVDRQIKKVMPNTKLFAINLNRLSGELPEWLLFHPALDLWVPFSLVFPQEGRCKDGSYPGFSNAPANLNYYYEHYTKKKNVVFEEEE